MSELIPFLFLLAIVSGAFALVVICDYISDRNGATDYMELVERGRMER